MWTIYTSTSGTQQVELHSRSFATFACVQSSTGRLTGFGNMYKSICTVDCVGAESESSSPCKSRLNMDQPGLNGLIFNVDWVSVKRIISSSFNQSSV